MVDKEMKLFKGVIKSWYREHIGDQMRIIGYAEYHQDPYLHKQMMHTSAVVKLELVTPTLVLCETKNSYYMLVGEEKK